MFPHIWTASIQKMSFLTWKMSSIFFSAPNGRWPHSGATKRSLRPAGRVKWSGFLSKLNTYAKKSISEIPLCGEKPHLPEKYIHNKYIFFAVQTFLSRSKRLFFNEQNKPNHIIACPPADGLHWPPPLLHFSQFLASYFSFFFLSPVPHMPIFKPFPALQAFLWLSWMWNTLIWLVVLYVHLILLRDLFSRTSFSLVKLVKI